MNVNSKPQQKNIVPKFKVEKRLNQTVMKSNDTLCHSSFAHSFIYSLLNVDWNVGYYFKLKQILKLFYLFSGVTNDLNFESVNKNLIVVLMSGGFLRYRCVYNQPSIYENSLMRTCYSNIKDYVFISKYVYYVYTLTRNHVVPS